MKKNNYLILLFLLVSKIGATQLSVTPSAMYDESVEHYGFQSYKHSFSISGTGQFKVTFVYPSTYYWFIQTTPYIDPGVTILNAPYNFSAYIHPSAVNIPAGTYTGKIIVTDVSNSANADTVDVTYYLAPKGPDPIYNYINGYPQNCFQKNSNYLTPDSCAMADAKPAGSFIPPPNGGTYIDPNFGAKVTVISDTGFTKGYYIPTCISANNKYVLGLSNNVLYDGLSTLSDMNGNVIHLPLYYSNISSYARNEYDVWDAYNDSIMYGLRNHILYKFNVITQVATQQIDFTQSPYNIITPFETRIGAGADNTKDNLVGIYNFNLRKAFVIDLKTMDVYTGLDADATPEISYALGDFDVFLIAKGKDKVTAKRYCILGGGQGLVVYSLDTINKKLIYEFTGPEKPEDINNTMNHDGNCNVGEYCVGVGDHTDTYEDNEGNQYLLRQSDDDTEIKKVELLLIRSGKNMVKPVELGGGKTVAMPIFIRNSYTYTNSWTVVNGQDGHVIGAKNAPVFVVCSSSGDRPESDVTSPYFAGAYADEVFMGAVQNGKTYIRRLIKHRNVNWQTSWGNWYSNIPRASIAANGKYVVVPTNFGETGTYSNQGVFSKMRLIKFETQINDFLTSIRTENSIGYNLLSVEAYPSPSTGLINIEITNENISEDLKNIHMDVVDVLGKIVLTKIISSNSFTVNESINLEKNGVYFIKIYNAENLRVEKIIINR